MKRDAFLEELAPAKRLRAAGGFEALPDGVLGTVVDFLVPVAERDDQFCQRRRMAERMFEALAYNHEFMPLARDALALLGSCRLLRYGPLFARTVVFHHMLHQNFLELCFEKLAEGCRLPSAFEARNDKLCVARQLAELLQLPLPEVLSDFDAICDKGWEERGITALEIREFCAWRGAPMFFVSCRGELLDAYQPPVKENRGVAFTCYQAHAYFYRSARAVSHCDDTPRNEGLYRGDRKETTVPPFSEWRPWAGRVESGHFWAEDLRSVRAALLAQGHQPKVTMRSVRLAGPAPPRPGRPRLRRHAVCRGRRNPPGLDAEAGPGVPGPAPGRRRRRGLPAPPQAQAPGRPRQPGPHPGGAELPLQALLRPHRAGQLRVRPRRPRAPGPGRPAPGAAGPVPGVPPDQDAPGVLPRRVPGEPRVPQRPRGLRAEPAPAGAGLQAGEVRSRPHLPRRGRGAVPQERPGQRNLPPARLQPPGLRGGLPDGHLADLTYVELHRDDRQALLRKLPYLGRGWYSKPAAAYLGDLGRARGATVPGPGPGGHGGRLAGGEEHMAKLSVNALIGLWARNQDLVYSMRTSNHELDGQGCQWRQTFTDAAGKVHWDHIYATELFSNYTLRPLHDYVMAQEHVAVAKIRDHLRKVPPRYVVALKTDCLVFQDLPKKFLPAVRELTARKHQDGTPVYRFEECKRLEGEYREPRIEAPYLTCYGPEWRSVEDPLLHCLNGKSLLLSGMPGTGKTHLARQIVAQLCELGEVVKLVSKTHCSVQNLGAGAQTADRFVRRSIRNGSCELDRLVIEEITQLDSSLWADIAELSLNPKVKFLLLGDFRQLPAVLDAFGGAPVTKPLRDSRLLHDLAGGCYHELTENHRSDEAIFGFLRYLRVDEAEEPPLREALQLARERFARRGQPDTCLVISHANRMRLNEQHNRRLAPAEAVTLRYEGRAAAGTNAPQTMRVWPGLRLVGAGGKVAKGCFVAVTEAGPDAVRLDTGERFTHAELLRHTRLCHAITYASCQGLTLQGRGAPVRHLQPALRAAPPVRRRLEGHQRRAAVRALGAFKPPAASGRAQRHRAGLRPIGSKAFNTSGFAVRRNDPAKRGRAHRPGVALLGDLSAAHPIRRAAAAPAQVGAGQVARLRRLQLVGERRAPVPAGWHRAPRTAHVRAPAAAARRAAL